MTSRRSRQAGEGLTAALILWVVLIHQPPRVYLGKIEFLELDFHCNITTLKGCI